MDIHALPTIFPAEANAEEQADPLGSNSAATVRTAKPVFDEYAPRIYHLVRRMLGNEADAQDVTQDVFLQIIRKLPSFRGEATFPTWLYRVAVNAALAFRCKRAVREEHRIHDPLEDFREDGTHLRAVRHWVRGPEKLAIDREAHELIESAIAKLPET